MWTLTLALFAGLVACDDQDTVVYSCQVELAELTPTEALPGETVVLTGKPMSTAADSALWIGGESVQVTDVTRSDCEVCDACKVTQGCVDCGEDCDACDADCLPCMETLSFTAPELSAGQYSLQLFNLYGASESALSLTLGESPTDTGDTGGDTGDSGDTGGDTGANDTGN